MTDIKALIDRWNTPEGHPYKGVLINLDAHQKDPQNIGCMCAQGQVLHLIGGWTPVALCSTSTARADKEVADLLNISLAHSILLRQINDTVNGAPANVLTHPEKILGDQAQTVLAFWSYLDGMAEDQWEFARDAAWYAARFAAGDAALAVTRDAARAAAGDARAAAGDAYIAAGSWASNEIQGARTMRAKQQPFFFLPMFGFNSPEAIPPLPENYGIGTTHLR